RPFQPINTAFAELGIQSPLAWNLAYFLALPINFLLELGVFLVAGLWWIRRRDPTVRGVKRHLLIGLGVLSLILVTFLQFGSVAANDFGYRGVLPAQFVLLLIATEQFDRYWRRADKDVESRLWGRLGVATLCIGLLTTFLNMIVLRHSIGFGNPGIGMYHVSLRAPHSAERLYDLRFAYEWIRKNTPEASIIQEDPLTWQSLGAQYGERRTKIFSWFVGDDIA